MAYETARYKVDPGPNKARAAAWYGANRERGIENARKTAQANPERTREFKKKWAVANPEVGRANVQRRRARLGEAEAEKFLDVEIYEQDGWICQLCHGPIEPKLRAPDPHSASLDHIRAVAKKGPHTRANVQAAHLICNQRKSDK